MIKHDGHLRTWGNCGKHEPKAGVFYISRVFSSVRSVLSHCLRLVSIWSQTIADDRGSQIADRRRSQRYLFPYNRGRSQSRLLPTFRSAEVSKLQTLYAGGKIASKQHGRRWEGNFAASKLISSFSPQATSSSASKPPKTSVLGSENIIEETRTWGVPHFGQRTSCFRQRVFLQVNI